jgi:hypothetical protein
MITTDKTLTPAPAPAPCPSWCPAQPHGWTDVRDHRSTGRAVEGEKWCRQLVGTVDGYDVEATQFNSFDTGYGDYDIERQVYFFGERLSSSDARQLAALLTEAAELVERAAGVEAIVGAER